MREGVFRKPLIERVFAHANIPLPFQVRSEIRVWIDDNAFGNTDDEVDGTLAEDSVDNTKRVLVPPVFDDAFRSARGSLRPGPVLGKRRLCRSHACRHLHPIAGIWEGDAPVGTALLDGIDRHVHALCKHFKQNAPDKGVEHLAIDVCEHLEFAHGHSGLPLSLRVVMSIVQLALVSSACGFGHETLLVVLLPAALLSCPDLLSSARRAKPAHLDSRNLQPLS